MFGTKKAEIPTSATWNDDFADAINRLSELLRSDPQRPHGTSMDATFDFEEYERGGFRCIRSTGWRTVTIRYFVDPKTHESEQLQIPATP